MGEEELKEASCVVTGGSVTTTTTTSSEEEAAAAAKYGRRSIASGLQLTLFGGLRESAGE